LSMDVLDELFQESQGIAPTVEADAEDIEDGLPADFWE